MKDTRKIVMLFEVEVPFDVSIDDETLKKEYGNDIKKFCKFMYKEGGIWWDKDMILVNAFIKNGKGD